MARPQGTFSRHALLSDKREEVRHGSHRIAPSGGRAQCLMRINVCTFIATNPAHGLGNLQPATCNLQAARRQAGTMLEKVGATYHHVGKAKLYIFNMSNRADIALLKNGPFLTPVMGWPADLAGA